MVAGNKDTKLSRTLASTETLRLAEMHTCEMLYTPIEERFERITRLARSALNVSVAAVTLISEGKQWFKSVAGWNVTELSLNNSLCTWTISGSEALFISDTKSDARFADHPLVAGKPGFRFYAGCPLVDRDGTTIGTFCVLDVRPRQITSSERQTILDLAALAQHELLSEQLSIAHTALAAKLGTARREAMMDPLTRLWNRRGVGVLLKAAVENADEHALDLALGLIDVDRFKRINDLHGHQIGDDALKKVARVLVASVRNVDIVCRYSGDEFLIIMVDTNGEQAARIIERVRRSVFETPIRSKGEKLRITISAGYAIRQPGDNSTQEELFARADNALMQSKAAGRNLVRMSTAPTPD